MTSRPVMGTRQLEAVQQTLDAVSEILKTQTISTLDIKWAVLHLTNITNAVRELRALVSYTPGGRPIRPKSVEAFLDLVDRSAADWRGTLLPWLGAAHHARIEAALVRLEEALVEPPKNQVDWQAQGIRMQEEMERFVKNPRGGPRVP